MASYGPTGGVSDWGVSRLLICGIGKSAFGNVTEKFPPAGDIGGRGFPLQARQMYKGATLEIQPLYDKLVCPFLNGRILFLYLIQIKPEKMCICVLRKSEI